MNYENEQEYVNEQASIRLDEQQNYQDQKHAEFVEALENPKNKYIQIKSSGSSCVQTLSDAKTFIDCIDDSEVYVFRAVYLTEKEFLALPEFTGF